MISIYSKHQADFFELPEYIDVNTRNTKIRFEVGDVDTLLAQRAFAAGVSNWEYRKGPESASLVLYMESFSSVLAIVSIVGAAVKSAPCPLPPVFHWWSEAGMKTQRSNYYPSQSVNTHSKEYFELSTPKHLDPARQMTSLNSG